METAFLMEFVGVVGLTLALATGKVLEPFRGYLRRFTHPLNPGPYFADLLSCSMCTGFWVGLVYGLCSNLQLGGSVIMGGLVSIASLAVYHGFQLSEAFAERILPGGGVGASTVPASQVIQRLSDTRRKKEVSGVKSKLAQGQPLTEDEADFLAGENEESADRAR